MFYGEKEHGHDFIARGKEDNRIFVEEATTLRPEQMLVRATANTATDDYTLTLPPVSLAAGRIYSIVAIIANSKTVTVTHQGDSEDFGGDYTLDTTRDRILLFSDGEIWWELATAIA